MEHLVFAYGTLLDPPVQRAVIGRAVAGTGDLLDGFRKSRVQDRSETFPNLVPQPGSTVRGKVLHLSAAELSRVDLYEGELYTRRRVTLHSGTEAWVYIA